MQRAASRRVGCSVQRDSRVKDLEGGGDRDERARSIECWWIDVTSCAVDRVMPLVAVGFSPFLASWICCRCVCLYFVYHILQQHHASPATAAGVCVYLFFFFFPNPMFQTSIIVFM